MQRQSKGASPARQPPGQSAPIRVVIVTMDTHLASAVDRARLELKRQFPELTLSMHAASEWGANPEALQRCMMTSRKADIIIAAMLFLEDHFQPILPALEARREQCDALVCAMSAGEVFS